MKKLHLVGSENVDPTAIPVVALAHNEANILPDFLVHYRAMGPVSFVVVDDHSTDGTADMLAGQPDVTVYQPVEGSTYSNDKADWRSELLDRYAAGTWCLVPDIDEHFIFAGADSLQGYISQLEGEGAGAVATLMIDMYADIPLSAHLHALNSDILLSDRFPLFDGPEGYVMRPITGKSGQSFPTPPIAFHGGPRDRLQRGPLYVGANAFTRWLLRGALGLDRPLTRPPGVIRRHTVVRAAKHHFNGALNMTKLGLLRWQPGMRFNGGAHKVDRVLAVSESIAGFLHYPFTRGEAGIRYIADRGQHVGGGKHYRALLDRQELENSLVTSLTRTYRTPSDLDGLIRPVPRH